MRALLLRDLRLAFRAGGGFGLGLAFFLIVTVLAVAAMLWWLAGGEPGVDAEVVRHPGQQVCATDVGHESDPDLGHGEARAVGDDPGVGVGGDTDTTTHHNAVHDGDIRLGVARDVGVEPVFVGPEQSGRARRRLGVTGAGAAQRRGITVNGHDVAAGTQTALAGTNQHHRADLRIGRPAAQELVHGGHHRMVERVDRLRPVQRQGRDPGVDRGQHGRFVHHDLISLVQNSSDYPSDSCIS